MTQLSWLFIGLVAFAATIQTLRTTDDQLAIISGLMGAIAWLLWSFGALDVIVYSGGVANTETYPGLAVFGVLMAMPNLFVALTGPLFVARDEADYVSGVR